MRDLLGGLIDWYGRALWRLWRRLCGRDHCERCDGTRGTPGNENIVDGQVVCDYCDAEMRGWV